MGNLLGRLEGREHKDETWTVRNYLWNCRNGIPKRKLGTAYNGYLSRISGK